MWTAMVGGHGPFRGLGAPLARGEYITRGDATPLRPLNLPLQLAKERTSPHAESGVSAPMLSRRVRPTVSRGPHMTAKKPIEEIVTPTLEARPQSGDSSG